DGDGAERTGARRRGKLFAGPRSPIEVRGPAGAHHPDVRSRRATDRSPAVAPHHRAGFAPCSTVMMQRLFFAQEPDVGRSRSPHVHDLESNVFHLERVALPVKDLPVARYEHAVRGVAPHAAQVQAIAEPGWDLTPAVPVEPTHHRI